jgi:hypothetical protein
MQFLSDKTGSFGNGETSWEDGDSRFFVEGKRSFKKLIDNANSVPLVKIFQHYGINLNEYSKRTTCPFSTHSSGKERTPSFFYYHKTNSYFCFGCKHGSTPVDFVSKIEGISKEKASHRIIEIFHSDVDENAVFNRESFDERLQIMMDFSNLVREFRKENPSEEANVFIENTCRLYDNLNNKLTLSNEALRELVHTLFIKGIIHYQEAQKLK